MCESSALRPPLLRSLWSWWGFIVYKLDELAVALCKVAAAAAASGFVCGCCCCCCFRLLLSGFFTRSEFGSASFDDCRFGLDDAQRSVFVFVMRTGLPELDACISGGDGTTRNCINNHKTTLDQTHTKCAPHTNIMTFDSNLGGEKVRDESENEN